MKTLTLVLSLAISLLAIEQNSTISVLDFIGNDSNVNELFTNKLKSELIELDEYTITSPGNMVNSIEIQTMMLSGAFRNTPEVGALYGWDYYIVSKVNRIANRNYSIFLELVNIETGVTEGRAERLAIGNISEVYEYDISDLVHQLFTGEEVNSRLIEDDVRQMLVDAEEYQEELEHRIYEYENPKVTYLALGISGGYSDEGYSYGSNITFKYRNTSIIGLGHHFRIKQNSSANLDGYFTYDDYSEDYNITFGMENDFILSIGRNWLELFGGVSLDTYLTDTETDLWSDQGDYGFSKYGDNRFTSVGFNAGITASVKGISGYYGASVMYRNVNSNHSIVASLTIEI